MVVERINNIIGQFTFPLVLTTQFELFLNALTIVLLVYNGPLRHFVIMQVIAVFQLIIGDIVVSILLPILVILNSVFVVFIGKCFKLVLLIVKQRIVLYFLL